MTHLDVFDPPMCCSTGVCGPSVDPLLAAFAADVDWLASKGVSVTPLQPRAGAAGVRRAPAGQRRASARGRRLPAARARRTARSSATARIRDARSSRALAGLAPGVPDEATHPPGRGGWLQARVRVLLMTPLPFAPDARPVLHRQGRRRQDVARLRDRRGARGRGPPRAARLDRSGLESRRGARRRLWQPRRRAVPARPRSVGAQHRPGGRRPRLPRARRRPVPRPAAGLRVARMEEQLSGACTIGDRRVRRVHAAAGRSGHDDGVRPRHLRHRADRSHAAPVEAARGLDRLHRHQHDRHVVPRPAGRSAGAARDLYRRASPRSAIRRARRSSW